MSEDVAPAGRPSLAARAFLAVALTVGFYTLAFAIVLLLGVAPIVTEIEIGHGNIWITIAGIAAAISIVRAIIPDRHSFDAPGPQLTRSEHPALFAVIDEVAATTAQSVPDDVYLESDLNASVRELPGRKPRRRVLVLGLPLMVVLRPDGVRAVVAHELAHTMGGDVRFTAWIWRTRLAVVRVDTELRDSDSWFRRTIVRRPFDLYARLFLRLTNAVSKRQELVADAVSVSVVGASVAAEALRAVEFSYPAFVTYWNEDVLSALSLGRRPPLADGFHRFLEAWYASGHVEEVLADQAGRCSGRYDSHPVLVERLAAMGEGLSPLRSPPNPSDSALALLGGVGKLERDLVRLLADGSDLEPIEWGDVGLLHLELARGVVRENQKMLAGLTLGDAGDRASDPERVAETTYAALGVERWMIDDVSRDRFVIHVLASAVVVALADRGWVVQAPPGAPVSVVRMNDHLAPGPSLGAVRDGGESAADWRERMNALGVDDVPLDGL